MNEFAPSLTASPAAAPVTAAPDPMGDPLRALSDGGVLAVITGVEGAHYRNPGTIMAFPASGGAVGQLSSGCIDADLALQAAQVAADGQPRRLRYGEGSPFRDLVLPCGGGLDVALIPVTDPQPIRQAVAARDARLQAVLGIDLDLGSIALNGPGFQLQIRPETRFLVWGAGVEAVVFAALCRAAGYPTALASHDDATARAAAAQGVAVNDSMQADAWTAVTLFYHDHDREPALLARALATPAFYIGAQGSLRSHQTRLRALREMGVAKADLARLRGPMGLIPSARDPKVLAVSVLAEILSEASP